MARETEIERLVVRLVGDDASYRTMMQNAVAASSVFEQESEAVADAQEKAQEALNETLPPLEDIHNEAMRGSRSFRFLGQEVQQAGTLVSGFNVPAGMTVIVLGEMTSAVGQAMHTYRALGASMQTIGGLIGRNIGLFAGSAVAIAGTVAYVATYKYVMNDLNKTLEKNALLQTRILEQQSYEQTKRIKGINAEDYLPFRAELLEKEIETQKALYAGAIKDADEFKDKLENIHWYTGGSAFIRDAMRAEAQAGLEEATVVAEEARKAMRQAQSMQDDVEIKIRKQKYDQGLSQRRGINEDINGLVSSYKQLTMSEKEAARAAFIAKNDLAIFSDPVMLKAWEEAYDLWSGARDTEQLESMSDSLTDMKNRAKEILDPLNSQLRITHELEKANRDYARAHNIAVENVPKEIQEKNQLLAAEREHQRLLQEGRTVYDQYKDPLDKMIESQKRLKQLFEAGGFEKGEKGARAYQKALAEAYGQAHKDYTAQFLGQQFDALIGGTHAAERALYEYRLATTAIPLDVVRASKSVAAKSKSESPSNAFAGLDDDDKKVNRQIADNMKSTSGGIAELVKLTKEKTMSLSYATFS